MIGNSRRRREEKKKKGGKKKRKKQPLTQAILLLSPVADALYLSLRKVRFVNEFGLE